MGEGKRRQLRYEELQRILGAGDRSEIRKVIDEVTRYLADTGMIIEAGWLSLKIMAVRASPVPVGGPTLQGHLRETRSRCGARRSRPTPWRPISRT